jgi:DNA-binding PadR family transcriptional regulator
MLPTPSTAEVAALLPLRSVDFLILVMLARGDRHGYGLMRDVEAQTDGAVVLEAGSLYRTIRRLLDEKLVMESARRPAADLDDDRRRYYRLSPFGRRVLAAEAARLRQLVRLAEASRVLAPEPG